MDIDIKRNGSRPSTKGSPDWFTGSVRVDPLFQAPDPGRVSGGQVTFEPGARTAWHTHPLGQTLVVTAGLGWVQREGGPIEEIRAGRRRVVSAGPEALARRFADDRDDAHRHSGIRRRKERRLDGEGRRRPIPEVRSAMPGWECGELRKIDGSQRLMSPRREDVRPRKLSDIGNRSRPSDKPLRRRT